MNTERELLRRLGSGPVSGAELARGSGQTRAAVWKRIEALRAAGVGIDAVRGRGYMLAQPLVLLESARILAALPADVRAQVHVLDVAWAIDSTNAELLRRTRAPRGTDVLLAERQTAGRGRRGRAWVSPLASNLYVSVARDFAGGLARLGGLSLVAGVAVADALHALGAEAVRLKWPNDLVVEDRGGLRKLGGLLVEGGGEHAGPVRAVVGLGLNIAMPTATGAEIDQAWTDLASVPGFATPDRNLLAATLLASLLPALARFDAEGLAPFLPRLARLDALAGREVEVRDGHWIHAGTALGLGSDGALRVRLADGDRDFHAGEVSVRRGGARA